MFTKATTVPLAEQATLCRLLSLLGHHPDSSSESEQLFKNVLRRDEKKPTLSINPELDVWFDQTAKTGGGLIDFGRAYWTGLSADEVASKINKLFLSYHQAGEQTAKCTSKRKRRAVKLPYYRISEIRPLGGNKEIMAYLKEQGVWEISIGHLKEVYYFVVDEKGRRKEFFAAGWQNENGGWQVMARNFSGTLGPKGLAFIPGSGQSLTIFRHYPDYIEWKYRNHTVSDDILVINGTEFEHAAIRRAARYQNVTDMAGLFPDLQFPIC